MVSKIRTFFQKDYNNLNKLEISKSALKHNYKYLSCLAKPARIAPVLKSNAYGHGIIEIAEIMDPLGAPFFCVDSLFEAYQLLNAGIKTPILIMGYVGAENLKVKPLPFSFAVFSLEILGAIKKYQPHSGIHIFIDTGMHREGVPMEDFKEFYSQARKMGLKVEGLMSHLATPEKMEEQITKFNEFKSLINPKWSHVLASPGLMKLGKPVGNVVRVGRALYGVEPQTTNKSLKPAARLISTIVQIKELKKGEKVGYDFSFTAKKKMKIAVLTIGYNDGFDRRLSNVGVVQVHGHYCPVVGLVSMNISVIDVTKIYNVKVGDEAVIYSNKSEDKNSILNTAKLCGSAPYEFLVHLVPSTKRVIVP